MKSTDKKIFVCLLLFLVFIVPASFAQSREQVKVGSKKFTENVILGEIATQLIRSQNADAVHIRELGGTRILWNALLKGDIDVYPDYTGTIIEVILAGEKVANDNLKEKLLQHGIGIIYPLGFSNTYAIRMKKQDAKKLRVEKTSDLRNYPELKFGFTNEFMDRNDGWRGLQKFYHLPQTNVNGLDHDLAYRGLTSGSIDVIDLYSTDAEINYYNLKVLKDDLHYFTEYQAVLLYRKDLGKHFLNVVEALQKLTNTIPESLMIKMNSEVKIEGRSEEEVAAQFIKEIFSIEANFVESTFWSHLWHNTKEHLFLVLISLWAAILVSIPLGIFSYKNEKLGKVILSATGIIQTIPSLALLVFMIPLLGIGSGPAICALFLYSLLPIIRNTFTGLEDIPTSIKESAIVLGLSPFSILNKIELPLASRSILAGIKTSAVINVGTATLGALIGAGGYGQPILTGIRLDNVALILEGAVPAALLALIVQWMFDLSEKVIVPKGLRV